MQVNKTSSHKDEEKVDFKSINKEVHEKILKNEQASIHNLLTDYLKSDALYSKDNLDKNKEDFKISTIDMDLFSKINKNLKLKEQKVSKKNQKFDNNTLDKKRASLHSTSSFKRNAEAAQKVVNQANYRKGHMTYINDILNENDGSIEESITLTNHSAKDLKSSILCPVADSHNQNNSNSNDNTDKIDHTGTGFDTEIEDGSDSELEMLLKDDRKEKSRIVFKMRRVYDSLSDVEGEMQDVDKVIFLIYPNSPFLIYLELFIFLGSMYSLMYTPIYLIYFDKYKDITSMCINIVIDFVFILDMITGFFTRYYDIEENLVCVNKPIFLNYIQGWLFMDIISAIPFNSFLNYQEYVFDKQRSLIDITTLIRCVKIFKVISYNKNMFNITKLFTTSVMSRFFYSFICFLLISHFIACTWIFLGTLDYPNWIVKFNLFDQTFTDKYVASVYFNLATIYTIGYGDILSVNMYERVYNVFLLMVGIMIYSYAVSSLSNYVQERDEKSKKLESSLSYLDQLKLKYRINETLYRKIKRFLKYEYSVNKLDNNTFVSQLPTTLRNDMMYHMYFDIIHSFAYFKTFDNLDFIFRVLLTFRPIRVLRNEILVKDGDFMEETIFVKNGVLSLETTVSTDQNEKTSLTKNFTQASVFERLFNKFKTNPSDNLGYKLDELKILKIIQIRRNEHFGDVLMFLNRPSPLRVRVKSKFAELFLMKKVDLANIARDFPKIFKKIYSKSVPNMDKIVSMVDNAKQHYYETQIELKKEIENIPLIMKVEEEIDMSTSKTLKSITEKQISPIESSIRNKLKQIKQDTPIISQVPSYFESLMANDNEPDAMTICQEKDELEHIGFMRNDIEWINPLFKDNIMKSNDTLNSDTSFISVSHEHHITAPKNKPSIVIKNETICNSMSNDTIYGYFSKNLEKFIIDEGYINQNGAIKSNNPKYLKIQSITWMNKKIHNAISFSLGNNSSGRKIAHSNTVKISDYVPLKLTDNNATLTPMKRRMTKLGLICDDLNLQFGDILNSKKDDNLKRTKSSYQLEARNETEQNLLSIPLPINKQKTISALRLTRSPTKIKTKSHDMFTEVQKNIESSNLNLNDPGNFYKNWLMEIHLKRQDKTKKTHVGDKLNKKLEKIEEMLKDKFFT
jgi:hypothetical protein